MIKEYLSGIKAVFQAPRFIWNNRLAWTLLVPVFLNIILFSFGFSFTNYLSNQAFSVVEGWIAPEVSGIDYGNSILELTSWIILILFKILFFIVFAYLGGFIVLLIISPLLAFLSEKTEQIKTGVEVPFSLVQLLKDLVRGVVVTVRNMVFEVALTIAVLLLALIPVANLIAPVLLFFISAYYYGFSFMDYNLERRKIPMKASVQYIKNHRALTIGVATPFALLLLVPVIGVALSGFVAIFSTVGATLAILEKELSSKPKKP